MVFGHAGTKESSPWVLPGLSSPGRITWGLGVVMLNFASSQTYSPIRDIVALPSHPQFPFTKLM